MNYLEYNKKDIQSFEYETTIISDGNVIGTCELGKAEIQLLNNSNEYSSFKKSWIKTIHGSFYVYDVTPVQEKINIKLSCYDIKYKLDTKYDSSLYEWPMTLVEWRNAIAVNCGIEFNDNNVFPNSDIVLEKEPYVILDASNRTVISMIAQAGCSLVVTDENDFFYFSWFSENEHIVKDWLELTTERDYTSPVNVVVLGRGDVEDNVFYPNPKPEKPLEFRIDNNYILDPQEAEDKRYDVIEAIYNQVNSFSYLIFNMRAQDIENKLAIKLGEKIKYFDIWDNELNAYVMTKKITYLGGDLSLSDNYEITLSAEKINETSTDFSYASSLNKRILTVERKTDKVEGQILDIVKKTDENSSQIAELEIKSEGIDLAVETAQEAYDKVEVYNPVLEAEGNGQLSLPDCAGEKLLEFTVEGKSEQKKYTGKNIFDYVTTLKTSTGGLTNTLNPDGSITTTGILNTNYIGICGTQNITDILEDGQTYTAWQENLNGGSNLRLIVYINNKETNTTASYVILESVNSKSFTVDKTKYYYTINIQTDTTTNWGTSSRTFTNKYMLVKGNDTIFEPYVGRTSSPNPNYPSEIKNISGIENLFSIDDTTTPTKIIDGEATITTAAYDPTKFFIKVSKNQPYTLSFINDNASSTYPIRLQVKESDSSGNAGTKIADDTISYTSKHVRTIAPITEYIIIEMFRGVASSKTTIINEIQLEKGSKDHNYVPYGSNYLVGKVVGKNKFDYSKIIRNANINSSGTVISSTPSGNYTVNLNYVEVKPNMTYVLSSNISRQWVYNFFSEIPAIGVTGTSRIVKNGINQTFTTPSDAKYMVIREDVSYDNSVERNDNQEIQLEEKVQTEYEEYKEAISLIDLKNNLHELSSIGDVKDELVVKDGLGVIDKSIWEVTLDNSFTISSMSTVNGKRRFKIVLTDLAKTMADNVVNKVLSNKFIAVSGDDTYLEKNGISVIGDTVVIYYDAINTYTDDEFKIWLSNNPITLQYELATPKTIDLGEVSIETVQSDCTLELEEELDTDMYAKYVKNNPYNEIYPTKIETLTQIQLAEDRITESVSKTYATTEELATERSKRIQTANEISQAVSTKVGEDEIISKINQSAEAIKMNADKIDFEGKEISMNGTVLVNGILKGYQLNLTDDGTYDGSPITISYGENQKTVVGSQGIEHYTDDYYFVLGNQKSPSPGPEVDLKILSIGTQDGNAAFEVVLDSTGEYGSGITFKNNGRVLMNVGDINELYTVREVFNSDSGEEGEVVFDTDLSLFSYLKKIEIYYCDNNGKECGTQTVYDPIGEYITLSSSEISNSQTVFNRSSEYLIVGNKMTPLLIKCGLSKLTISSSTGTQSWSITNNINYLRIKKVVAYFNG